MSIATSEILETFAAVLVVAEGFYTRTQLSEESPGRPSILPIFAGVTGLIAVSLLCFLVDRTATSLSLHGIPLRGIPLTGTRAPQ